MPLLKVKKKMLAHTLYYSQSDCNSPRVCEWEIF